MAKRRKRNVQDEQVEAILSQLAKGVAPWAKPWQSLGHQRNAATGRLYNGGNAVYLSIIADNHGYGTPLWVTSKQAQAMGGHVKGRVCSDGVETQKSEWDNSHVVLWFRPDEYQKKDKYGKPIFDDEGKPEKVTYWRHGCQFVYNVEQTTIDPKKYAKYLPKFKEHGERNASIEEFLSAAQTGSGFSLSFGGDRAYYMPATDSVKVPVAESFSKIEEFYSTEFHEFAHATGHKSRLARIKTGAKGKDEYAEEELVAEMTAAFLGAEFQIDGRCQHAEYLGHWFKVIDNDQRVFYRAASKAKKAVAFLKEASQREAENEAEDTKEVSCAA